MRTSKTAFALTLGVIVSLAGAAPTALAGSTTYTYTGNDFTTGTFLGFANDSIDLSITFAAPLIDNLPYTNETGSVLFWSSTGGTWSKPK